MILPDVKVKVPKGRFKKAWDYFSGAEPDDSDAITVPTPTLMRSKCMEIHLQPTRDILLNGSFKIGLEVALNGCVSLIQCAFLQWVEHRGMQYSWEVTDISPVSSYFTVYGCFEAYFLYSLLSIGYNQFLLILISVKILFLMLLLHLYYWVAVYTN